MYYRNDSLWKKIKDFSFDEPGVTYPFSKKLAVEKNWQEDFTLRAIEEYRRFIYLCCISISGASPSTIVDEVWHMHLTYTINYWKKFCGETLQKEIHHNPSKGGIEEKTKHEQWYRDTLQQYEITFNEKPPADIWHTPTQESRASKELNIPSFFERGNALRFFLLIIPFFITYTAYGQPDPFGLSGVHFLLFYGCLCVSAIICTLISLKAKRKLLLSLLLQLLPDAGKYNPLIIADEQSVRFGSLLAALKREQLIQNATDNKYPLNRQIIKQSNHPMAELLSQHIGDTVDTDILITYSAEVYKKVKANFQAMEQAYDRNVNNILVPLVVTVTGVLRILQGISNDRPVGFLVGMVFIFIIACSLIFITSNFLYTCQELCKKVSASKVDKELYVGLLALGITTATTPLFSKFASTSTGNSCSSGCSSSCSSCSSGCGGCSGS